MIWFVLILFVAGALVSSLAPGFMKGGIVALAKLAAFGVAITFLMSFMYLLQGGQSATISVGIVSIAAVLIIVAGVFLRLWRDEFVFLMDLRDEDFPGRHDKSIWAIVLVTMGPIGVWLFRSYRLAHWDESDLVPSLSKPMPVRDLLA